MKRAAAAMESGNDSLRRDARSGTVAVELALILPFLVLLFTALFDIGFAAYESMQVQAAAAAGAHYAALNPWNSTQIAAVVAGATGTRGITAVPAPSEFCACPASGSLAPVDCSNKCTDGSTPSLYAEVNAQLQHFTVLSYPALPEPLTLTGQAITRIQ